MWKPVVGYDGIYEVSDLGVVRSIDRSVMCTNRNGTFLREYQSKVLKQNLHRKGYVKVRLYDMNGKWKQWFVHRLVAIAFIDNPENLPQVNHKDGNKLNNSKGNLEWSTNAQNMKHAYDSGVRVNSSGQTASRAKLKNEQVLSIVQLRRDGQSLREVSASIGCSIQTAHAICSGRSWSSVTGIGRQRTSR